MLILGIDPGTATTGWGIIKKGPVGKGSGKNNLAFVDYGCIVTTPKTPFPQRLRIIRKELRKLITETKPHVVCIEEQFFGKNKKTAISVSQARGVILEACASLNVEIFEYQGFKIKHALTGERFAKKKQVEKSVKKILGKRKLEKPKDGFLDDAVDGLAIAIYHTISS